jgi:hypothetical protein
MALVTVESSNRPCYAAIGVGVDMPHGVLVAASTALRFVACGRGMGERSDHAQ